MPVQYPAGLPGPSAYPFVPRERRATPGISGFQELRSRARDAIVDAPGVRWRYTPEEFATWLTWYEQELLIGQKWFAVTLPGRGGPLPRVARYAGPVQRNHLANGNFELSADLELRGIAQPPRDRIVGDVPVIGWLQSVNDPDGTAAHNNAGSNTFEFGGIGRYMYAGVVDYASGPVVWSADWAPLVASTAPVLLPVSASVVRVDFRDDTDPFNQSYRLGMLTLRATVDGVAVSPTAELLATSSFDSGIGYDAVAWLPEDYVPPPPPPPPPPPSEIGWHAPITSSDLETASYSNTGAAPTPAPSPVYASYVDYSAGELLWAPEWYPSNGTDPSPTVTPIGGAGTPTVEITGTLTPGVLFLFATLDGVAVDNALYYENFGGVYYWG